MFFPLKISTVILTLNLVGFTLLSAGCGENSLLQKDVKAPVFGQPQVIVLGSTGILPNWTQTTSSKEDGGLEGYDIDVWKEIAKRNNFQLHWKRAEFEALFSMLDRGEINTIANEITTNPSRLNKYIFTDNYAYDGYVFVTKNTVVPDRLDWFKGKNVCVELSTNPRLILEQINETEKVGMNIKYLDSQSSMLTAVANGSYDAAFMIKTSAFSGIHNLKLELKEWDPHYQLLPICYPLKKTPENEKLRTVLNKTIREMRQDGTLAFLSMKWFGEDVTTEMKK